MFWRCLFLALAFLPLLAPPVRAADKAWEDCGQTADQDRKIAGCTKVLARGAAESETNRANAYVNRGYAYGTAITTAPSRISTRRSASIRKLCVL